MSTLTTYRLSIAKTDGSINLETGLSERETWVRRCDCDDQAEHHARRISQDHGGVPVRIQRPDATWAITAPRWVGDQ